MGILQVFVPQEIFLKLVGKESGLSSIVAGEVLGAIALIEPAAVFPFAGFLQQSGASYGAIVGFVMSAILIGIVTLPVEIQQFGGRFTITRNIITLLFVFFMGILFMAVL
jgi:uncharacterized membrane protein YraQ (UPF0718 family)